MKIEIAEPGRMTQTGSSLLKLIQNNDMPALDLLVRESVQNSLDARKPSSKYVEVDFITGNFANRRLSKELEGITRGLRKKFPEKEYNFIAIRDSYTVGLTGELDYKKVKNNDYGNLLKLAYEICKPQDVEGAGGSWGLGKTVYFRIGIGLVVYYSRIKVKGRYESRLVASFVENENSAEALIPVYKKQAKRGIAWWGEEIGENATQAVTDEEYIVKFLRIFGIKPYQKEQTGTTIIIPYIDREKLLESNRNEFSEEARLPYWYYDMESYLAVAVQRWYAPRLNNSSYPHGAYLKLRINGKGLAATNMEPVFKIVQALYNRACNVKKRDMLASLSKVEEVKVIKYLEDTTAGTVAYAKVTKEMLGMCAPSNKPAPYVYFNCEIGDENVNRPTVCFTRNPGMIVAYENVGKWTSGIPTTDNNEYILAIFVLNSWNKLKGSPEDKSLEEYVRKSEMADHTSWHDWSEGAYNPRIIAKIQNSINRIIGNDLSEDDNENKQKVNSGLGKVLGDMLLPPDGFGKRANADPKPRQISKLKKQRAVNFGIDMDNIKYLHDAMIIPVVLETIAKGKVKAARFVMQMDTESKRISMEEWEEKLGLKAPFEIKDCRIEVKSIDGKSVESSTVLKSNERKKELRAMKFEKLYTPAKTCYGVSISSGVGRAVNIQVAITVKTYRKDIKPAFLFEKEETNA